MNKTKQFWNWFLKNNDKFLAINLIEQKDKKEILLNDILEQLHKYNENLYFEIGGNSLNSMELIISAEGKREFFDEVEKLIADAPHLPNWKFIAFKQPSSSAFITEYEGFILDPKQMWFLPLEKEDDSGSFGLIVYLKNYTDQHKDLLLDGVFTVLETLLGEKTASLSIQYLEVDKLPKNPIKKGLIELVDLPKFIVWKNSKD